MAALLAARNGPFRIRMGRGEPDQNLDEARRNSRRSGGSFSDWPGRSVGNSDKPGGSRGKVGNRGSNYCGTNLARGLHLTNRQDKAHKRTAGTQKREGSI